MAEDSLVRWVQATPFGVLMDEVKEAWNAGNVRDVLELETGSVLVATETGGVWQISPTGTATPLSDSWDDPDTNCLVFGPDGSRHLFAGTENGTLWETDVSSPLPLLSWNQVPNLPDTGPIYRMRIVAPYRWLVLASFKGIFWSEIPTAAGGSYAWNRAIDDGSLPAGYGYYSLTLTSTDEDPDNRDRAWQEKLDSLAVVAGGMGRDAAPGGIFIGQWNANGLQMQRCVLLDDGGHDISAAQWAMGCVSVTAGDQLPEFTYALCSAKNSTLMLVARSKDGGKTFTACGTKVQGSHKDLTELVGGHGGDRNNCIAVTPWNADYVAIGWQQGPFTSVDGGQIWRSVDPSPPHLHSDLHSVYFAESPPAPNVQHRLYVASDGGLAVTDDLADLRPSSFSSLFNQQLANLQCSMPTGARGFAGSLGISARDPGVVACGLQDNGNVVAVLGPSPTPWRQLDGGDGGFNLLSSTRFLARNVSGPSPPEPIKLAVWNGASFADQGVIDIASAGPSGSPIARGLTGQRAGAVRTRFDWPAAPAVIAVASQGNDVYALSMAGAPSSGSWRYLSSLPLTGAAKITAVATAASGSIFIGSSDGQLFVLNPDGVIALPITLSPPATGLARVSAGDVACLVAIDDTVAFAALNNVSWSDGTATSVHHHVVGLDGLRWTAANKSLPDGEEFRALTADWTTSPPTVFVATEAKVYVTRDAGADWGSASFGLPTRPHCADMRFVEDRRGAFIYLSTWGRSLWVARLNADVGLDTYG